MCGRYYFDIDDKELKEIADAAEKNLYDAYKTGEIYPTNIAPIYIEDDNNIKSILAKWGFPKWDNKGTIINARVETLYTKSMFKNLISSKRCIIPATAFFEWKRDNDSKKTKDKYIFTKSNSLLYMAGLYNEITINENNKQISLFDNNTIQKHIFFTIITKDANSSVSPIHNRMPLIFDKHEKDYWLNGGNMMELVSKNNVFLVSEHIQ